MESWIAIAERLGVPVAVMTALLLGIFLSLRWGAKHVLRPIVQSHTSLVNTLDETSKDQAASLKGLEESNRRFADSLEMLSGNQRDLVEMKKNGGGRRE